MAVVTTGAVAPDRASGRSREWWEAWLPGLLVFQAIGALGAWFLAAYPQLALFVAVWEIAFAVALWYLWGRVKGILGPPKRLDVIYRPDGTSKVVRRTSLPQTMLGAACAMATLTVVMACLFVFSNLSTSIAIADVPVFAVVSFAEAGVFVMAWPENGSTLKQRLFSSRGLLGALAVVMGAVFLVVAVVPQLRGSAIFRGSPASWSKMLALAQYEADRRVNGAVLDRVSADPAYDASQPYDLQTPFVVEFTFGSDEGSGVAVSVLDSDPPRLRDERLIQESLRGSDLNEMARRFEQIKLGPRDVFRATEQEALQFARDKGVDPKLDISMDLRSLSFYLRYVGSAKNPTPWGWDVDYWFGPLGHIQNLSLTVDPATGAVLERGSYSLGAEDCSTCPAPMPQLTPGPTTTP